MVVNFRYYLLVKCREHRRHQLHNFQNHLPLHLHKYLLQLWKHKYFIHIQFLIWQIFVYYNINFIYHLRNYPVDQDEMLDIDSLLETLHPSYWYCQVQIEFLWWEYLHPHIHLHFLNQFQSLVVMVHLDKQLYEKNVNNYNHNIFYENYSKSKN